MKNIKLIIVFVTGFILAIGISNAYILNASEVTYDKKNTTLESEDVQGALDELGILANTLTDTSDATASASDILSGKTAYVNGSKITGSMKNFGNVTDMGTIASGTYSLTPSYLYTDQYAANASVTYTYTAPKNIVAFKFQFQTSRGGGHVAITNISGTSIISKLSDAEQCKTYIMEGVSSGTTIRFNLDYSIWSGYSNTGDFVFTGFAVFGS